MTLIKDKSSGRTGVSGPEVVIACARNADAFAMKEALIAVSRDFLHGRIVYLAGHHGVHTMNVDCSYAGQRQNVLLGDISVAIGSAVRISRLIRDKALCISRAKCVILLDVEQMMRYKEQKQAMDEIIKESPVKPGRYHQLVDAATWRTRLDAYMGD